jgi:hypothetical protein
VEGLMLAVAITLGVCFALTAAFQWGLWLLLKRGFARRSRPVPAYIPIMVISPFAATWVIVAYEMWVTFKK